MILNIDIVVDMEESHIQAMARSYSLPRYYADPEQMRRSSETGSTFKIIDTTLGEKADLFPLTMDLRYQPAFERRIRRAVDIPGREAFSVWTARPEDVIIGKMMAWLEGRSNRHPADIYEMMLFHYLGGDADLAFDFEYISSRLAELGTEVTDLWTLLNSTARDEVSRS